MPMTALDIYKVLPQTNCGDCGVPTCLAFAMQLATKKAGIDDCPHATDEAKTALAGAEAPPIRMVSVGPEAQCIVMGKETVFFRHEETFYHPTALAVRIRSDKPEDELRAALERVKSLVFDRVGQYVRVEMVVIEDADGDAQRFAAAASIASEMDLGVVLISHNMEDVFAVCDRAVVLRLGKNAADLDLRESTQEDVVGAITGAEFGEVPDGSGGDSQACPRRRTPISPIVIPASMRAPSGSSTSSVCGRVIWARPRSCWASSSSGSSSTCSRTASSRPAT